MPHVWALIWYPKLRDWHKDKLDMNVERVVSVILDTDSDSDWNKSDEEREEGFDSESFRMDRLSMEQGKMADKLGSAVTRFSL